MSVSLEEFRASEIQKAVQNAAAGFAEHFLKALQQGESSLTEDLEEVKRESEALEALRQKVIRKSEALKTKIRLQDDKSTGMVAFLSATFPNAPLDTIRLAWEAHGDVIPPVIRQWLAEQGDKSQPLPSPALSSASNNDNHVSSRETVPQGTEAQDSTISVSSEPLTRDTSSAKRPADTTATSLDLTANKRHRPSPSDYWFEPSVEPTGPVRTQRYRGTVFLYQVDGIHWAFRSPSAGPGYFVLLCQDPETERDFPGFKFDPWSRNRAKSHYTQQQYCHDEVIAEHLVSEAAIIQRYGYLVEDMTEESAAASNQVIEDLRKKKEKEKEARRNYKHKSRSSHNQGHRKQHSHSESRQAEERVAEADMGLYGTAYDPPGAEEPVRSDL